MGLDTRHTECCRRVQAAMPLAGLAWDENCFVREAAMLLAGLAWDEAESSEEPSLIHLERPGMEVGPPA